METQRKYGEEKMEILKQDINVSCLCFFSVNGNKRMHSSAPDIFYKPIIYK